MDNDDVIGGIFANVDAGSTFKSCLLVCHRWNRLVTAAHPTGRVKFANHILTLLCAHRSARWNWKKVSANPNIRWEHILAHPDLPWDYVGFSRNPNLTEEILRANDYKWNWNVIGANKSLNWYYLAEGYIDGLPISRMQLSEHPVTTWAKICLPQVRAGGRRRGIRWDWRGISRNPNMTWEIVADNLNCDWAWNWLSSNPNIRWEHMAGAMDLPWDWTWASFNPSIPFGCIYANQTYLGRNINWWWVGVSARDDVTWDDITKILDKPLEWSQISAKPSVGLDTILSRPDLPWNWSGVSRNPGVSLRVILANRDLTPVWRGSGTVPAWDWRGVSSNPGLTWVDVAEHMDLPWDFDYMSSNTFGWKKSE
jgi:hypothetical protein